MLFPSIHESGLISCVFIESPFAFYICQLLWSRLSLLLPVYFNLVPSNPLHLVSLPSDSITCSLPSDLPSPGFFCRISLLLFSSVGSLVSTTTESPFSPHAILGLGHAILGLGHESVVVSHEILDLGSVAVGHEILDLSQKSLHL